MGYRQLTAENYASNNEISGSGIIFSLPRCHYRPARFTAAFLPSVPSRLQDFGKTTVPVDGTVDSPSREGGKPASRQAGRWVGGIARHGPNNEDSGIIMRVIKKSCH
jgi:hypothetical protein